MMKEDGIDCLGGWYGNFCRSARTGENHGLLLELAWAPGGNIASLMAEMRRHDIAHAQEMKT
jgi:hypothetical protein